METQQQSRKLLRLIAAFSISAITLAIMPRLLPDIELSRRSILWVPVIHQILLAALLALIVWLITGKRRFVAILSVVLIVIVWGPNFAGAIEYSLTGENTTVLAVAERLRLTPLLNTVYGFLSDSLGYSLTVSRS